MVLKIFGQVKFTFNPHGSGPSWIVFEMFLHSTKLPNWGKNFYSDWHQRLEGSNVTIENEFIKSSTWNESSNFDHAQQHT